MELRLYFRSKQYILGLPNRKLLNRTFLTMALTYGLDIPNFRSKDEEMMDSIRAFRVLLTSDKQGKKIY